MYKLPEAPLSLGGILDDGFKLFRASWRKLLPVAFVASLLGAAPQMLIAGLTKVKPGEMPEPAAIGVGAVLTIVVLVLLSVLSYAVLLAGVHQAAQSEDVSIRAAVKTGISRTPALIGTTILCMLALAVGFLLLIIPGIYLTVVMYPAFLLPVVERLGPVASLSRGRVLVKGSWWRTAGVLTVMGLILIALVLVVSVVAGIVMAPVAATDVAGQVQLWVQVVAALLTAPLLPLGYCLMYAVYTDLRLRKDGGDLLSRVAAVGA
jgi:hypothetical protein